jgi:MFS superfamily sulfate permease-like transporter
VLGFLVGVMCLIMGLFRVGFINNLLSRPLLVGFVNASAFLIMLEQVRGVCVCVCVCVWLRTLVSTSVPFFSLSAAAFFTWLYLCVCENVCVFECVYLCMCA